MSALCAQADKARQPKADWRVMMLASGELAPYVGVRSIRVAEKHRI
jgi:hypothetical protein